MPEILYEKPDPIVEHRCVQVLNMAYRRGYGTYPLRKNTVVKCDCGRKWVKTSYNSRAMAWEPFDCFKLIWWKLLFTTPHPEPTAEEKALESMEREKAK